jgi:hypothetical protein
MAQRLMVNFIIVCIVISYFLKSNHQYAPKSQRSIWSGRISYRLQALQRDIRLAQAWLLHITTRYQQDRIRRSRLRVMRQLAYQLCPRPTTWCSTYHQVSKALLAFTALAYAAEGVDISQQPLPDMFDTDTTEVGIDNQATACMSDNIADFVGPLVATNRVVKGFAGHRTSNVQRGTIEWRWADDDGKVTTHRIPNSFYVPDGKVRLLSPQHWASTLPISRRPLKGVAPEETFHDRIVMRWDQGQSTRTILLDKETNVANLSLAPGFNRFNQFCLQAQICDHEEMVNPCHSDSSEVVEHTAADNQDENFELPHTLEHGLNGLFGPADDQQPNTEHDMDTARESATAEFLRYHHKYNHVSPRRIQAMARAGTIPKRLANCPVPVCTACLYGNATRKPWRSRYPIDWKQAPPATRPGQVVSVDQMKSPTPGLVAQMTGSLTKARYETATIFVDHASDLSYVHLQKSASAADTVEAKEAFERYSRQHGVAIAHYHCDNGVFTAHLWRNDCTEKRQGLSFSGVNAHHQNGRAEKRIRDLQQAARTMLIHAHRRWPAAITPHLWPYAMRLANESLNATPRIKDNDNRSPLSIFGGVEVDPNPRYWHHFGCPVYVLAQPLQTSGGMFHKWRTRARVGVYLGRSLQHTRLVALVLSLETGLVSPQFHVSFDSAFQTVVPTTGEPAVPSHWQKLAGLHEETSPPEEPASPSHSKGASPLPQLDAPLPDNVEPGGFLQLENDFDYEPEGQPSTEPPADSSTALPNNETVTSATNSPANRAPRRQCDTTRDRFATDAQCSVS